MFHGMRVGSAEKFLLIGHADIVDKRKLKTLPTYARGRRRSGRKQRTSWPAVLIEYERKLVSPQFARSLPKSARQNLFGNRGIPFQDRSAPGFNQYANPQIRAPGMNGGYRGSFEHNIAQ
jgi:hypothetical protein